VVILDSPVYKQAESGEQMVLERQAQFEQLVGFPSKALPSRNYLTEEDVRGLGAELGLYWKMIKPFYGLRWALKPWLARLRRGRKPARFVILVYERN
jgi:hypothetical protein